MIGHMEATDKLEKACKAASKECEALARAHIPNIVHFSLIGAQDLHTEQYWLWMDLSLADKYGKHSPQSKNYTSSDEIIAEEIQINDPKRLKNLIVYRSGRLVASLKKCIETGKNIGLGDITDPREWSVL